MAKKFKAFSGICALVMCLSAFGFTAAAKTPTASKAIGDGFGTLTGREYDAYREPDVGFFAFGYDTEVTNTFTNATLRSTMLIKNHSGGAQLGNEPKSAKGTTYLFGDFQLDHINNWRNILFDTYGSHEALYTHGYVVYTSNQYKW